MAAPLTTLVRTPLLLSMCICLVLSISKTKSHDNKIFLCFSFLRSQMLHRFRALGAYFRLGLWPQPVIQSQFQHFRRLLVKRWRYRPVSSPVRCVCLHWHSLLTLVLGEGLLAQSGPVLRLASPENPVFFFLVSSSSWCIFEACNLVWRFYFQIVGTNIAIKSDQQGVLWY